MAFGGNLNMKEIFSALIKAQGMLKSAVKDSSNPHYKSKYADLESVWDAVRDALQKNSLAVLQLTDVDSSGAPVLITRVIHTSGEHIDSRYPLICKDMNDPQKMGSALSYARRYCLGSLLGVISSDDDGNAASNVGAHASAKALAPAQTKAPSTVPQMFEAIGEKYPEALEFCIGRRLKDWTENDKSAARAAVDEMRSGKSWGEAKSTIAKLLAFS
jgi:hypothetical protein